MNILFMSLADYDNLDEQGIYTDLLRGLSKNSSINLFIISPVEKRNSRSRNIYESENVKIFKPYIGNVTKTNPVEKTISTLNIERTFTRLVKREMSNIKFDLILYPTPPITFVRTVDFVKKRDGAISYLLLKDIFPQNAVDLKMISKKMYNPIYWYFRNKEINLYKTSDYIGCMSELNKQYLISNNRYLDENIVEVNPNSIDLKYKSMIINKTDSISNNEDNKLPVFMYGGNIGKPQGVKFIKKVLKLNEVENAGKIIIIGSGTEFNSLRKYCENFKNVEIKSQLPKDKYENLLETADVGLIFLDKNFTIPNYPSRILSYMDKSKPVLAATDSNTDIRDLIINNEMGMWCESRDPVEFVNLMKKFNKESISKMGTRSRETLVKKFDVRLSIDLIMSKVKREDLTK